MRALTDRPLRLVASLFWFVCAVLLLVRGREESGERAGRAPGPFPQSKQLYFHCGFLALPDWESLGLCLLGLQWRSGGAADRRRWRFLRRARRSGSQPWLLEVLRGGASSWPRAAEGLPRSRSAGASCRSPGWLRIRGKPTRPRFDRGFFQREPFEPRLHWRKLEGLPVFVPDWSPLPRRLHGAPAERQRAWLCECGTERGCEQMRQ